MEWNKTAAARQARANSEAIKRLGGGRAIVDQLRGPCRSDGCPGLAGRAGLCDECRSGPPPGVK